MKKQAVLSLLFALGMKADVITSPDQIANPVANDYAQFMGNPPACDPYSGCMGQMDIGAGTKLSAAPGSSYGYSFDTTSGSVVGNVSGNFSTIRFSFDLPTAAVGIYVKEPYSTSDPYGAILTAFDSNGAVLGNYNPYASSQGSLTDKGYFAGWDGMQDDPIAALEIYSGNSYTQFNELVYQGANPNGYVATATPEPGTVWLTSLVGAILMLFGLKRRKKQA